MTTQSWSSKVRHDSDAEFRLWGAELKAKLAAVGLTQTADTGQIDWTTVVRAGTNADAGYEVWRFNDAAHSTAPIFFRLYYGTGSGTTTPRIRIQVGTGSDGAGNLTGGNGTILSITVANNAQTAETSRTSYLCYAHGALWLSWKEDASATGLAFASFAIFRNCTSTGAVDDGSMAALGSPLAAATEIKCITYRWDSPGSGWDSAAWGGTTLFTCNDPTSSTDWLDENGDIQLAIISFNVKRARPFIQLCGYNTNDIAEDVTFSATLFGSTAHTYMAKGRNLGQAGIVSTTNSGSSAGLALIWE